MARKNFYKRIQRPTVYNRRTFRKLTRQSNPSGDVPTREEVRRHPNSTPREILSMRRPRYW